MLGTSSEYLAQQTQVIGNFGSKHQWGTIKTENGIYGVDFARGIIWKTGSQSAGNQVMYVAEDITITKNVQSWLKEYYEIYNPTYNPLKVLKDTPANNEGLIVGYDRLNKEVLFTFLSYIDASFEDYDLRIMSPINKDNHINVVYRKNFVVSYLGKIYYSLIPFNHYDPNNYSAWEEIKESDCVNFITGNYNAGDIVIGFYNNKFYIVVVEVDTIASVDGIEHLFATRSVSVTGTKTVNIYNYIEVSYEYFAEHRKTLVFSEKLNAFQSEYSFTPIFYSLLNNMMMSSLNNSIHIHNQSDSKSFHGGKIAPFMISFVVSGKSSENDATMFYKYFASLDIEINDIILKQINYKTDLQEGVYLYSRNSSEFWKDAEYFEGKLKLPIYVQTDPDTEFEDGSIELYKDSDMKGTFLVVTLVYEPLTNAEKITLRNVITNFNISQS